MLGRGGSTMSDANDGPGSTLGFTHVRMIDAVCDAFERAWKENGDTQPSLEEFLQRLPEELRELAVMELLPIEIAYLRRRGAAIPLEDYRQRYPFVGKRLDQWASGGASPQTLPRLETGERLGKYTIVGPLGAGGMGEVYRASDPFLGRDVAIKVLLL